MAHDGPAGDLPEHPDALRRRDGVAHALMGRVTPSREGLMSDSATDTPRPPMEVRGSWACSVIVHRVPPDGADRFMEWQRGITRVAGGFPGYRGTDIYPPAEDRQRE